MSFGYPVSLEVSGRKALVVGRDAVAQGKAEALLAAGAEVTVVSEGPPRALSRLEATPGVTVHRRPFRPKDLDGTLVCAASSSDPVERDRIAAEARARGVLVNVMDDPPNCDFAAPAVVRRGDLTIAISTGGRSPALARRLREDLEDRYGEEWEDVIALLGDVRRETLAGLPDLADRSRRWQRALATVDVPALVRSGRGDEARLRLRLALAETESEAAS